MYHTLNTFHFFFSIVVNILVLFDPPKKKKNDTIYETLISIKDDEKVCITNYPMARAVTAHATMEADPAAARLSFLQNLIWLAPANFDATPITAAKMENVKKKGVAPLPPKPSKLVFNK